MTLISIVIPMFNAAQTLGATIDTLKSQNLTTWEAILVDDGSTDGSLEIAQCICKEDPRFRIVINPGKGPSAARNHGAIDCAKGEIIAFCDADDLWTKDKLRSVLNTFSTGKADAVFGRVGFFSETPKKIGSHSLVPTSDVTVPMLLGENPVCTTSNLSVRAATFTVMNGFDETMVHNEDLEFLIRLVGTKHRLVGVNEDHVLYRRSPGGLSADLTAMKHSRAQAVARAQKLGFQVSSRQEAIFLRYLARRALRMDARPGVTRSLVVDGLRHNLNGFLFPARRGVPIALGAALLPVLPAPLRHALFSK